MSQEKLGTFLREVSNWDWEEFCRAEDDKGYTSNEAMIFALIRSCAMQKMDAIRMSLNRLDGKLKTPVRVEYPKIFYLFPNAKLPAHQKEPKRVLDEEIRGMEVSRVSSDRPEDTSIIASPAESQEEDLPSLSLRETLAKMSDYPRELPEAVVARAQAVESAIRGQSPMPSNVPRVKSVVAAHLLLLAQSRNVSALTEVFDQIDGKLVETIQLLGEDIFITSYVTVAPEGAALNENGVLQMEATQAQNQWAEKLGKVIDL